MSAEKNSVHKLLYTPRIIPCTVLCLSYILKDYKYHVYGVLWYFMLLLFLMK